MKIISEIRCAAKCLNNSFSVMTLVFVVFCVYPVCSDDTRELPSCTASSADDNNGAGSYTTAYINVSYTDPETGRTVIDKAELGKFGEGFVGSSQGLLVQVYSGDNDLTSCRLPLKNSLPPGDLPPFDVPWIALIKRGLCDFEVKVENAFRSHASAVLIYDDRASIDLHKMKLTDKRNISAVFTYHWKGEYLAKLVNNGTRIDMQITVGNRCTRSYTNINRTSVLFVSASFIVVMFISLAWLVFYYVQRFRYIHAKDRLSKRLCSAAKKALSKIPTRNIKLEDKEMQGEGECCAICIEPYKVSETLRILPCKHDFHKSCIDPWLLEHRTCPMCKMDILKHYGFVFTGSQESILHMEEEASRLNSSSSPYNLQRSLSPLPQIRPSEVQLAENSRASSPNEMSPVLSQQQCYEGATSQHCNVSNTSLPRNATLICSESGLLIVSCVPKTHSSGTVKSFSSEAEKEKSISSQTKCNIKKNECCDTDESDESSGDSCDDSDESVTETVKVDLNK